VRGRQEQIGDIVSMLMQVINVTLAVKSSKIKFTELFKAVTLGFNFDL